MAYRIVYSDQLLAHNVHTHLNYEMLYVTEGEVRMLIGGRAFPVHAGCLVFLNQFDEHATRLCSDTYRRYTLLIPPAQMEAFRNDLRLLSVFRFHGSSFPYVFDVGASKPRFDQYFSLMAETARHGGQYLNQRMEALMTLILTDVYALNPSLFLPEKQSEILSLQSVLEELDRSFAHPPTLPELSRKCHVSPACLSRRFREYVGMSPMQYITQSRLTHAKQLLLSTDIPIAEIAPQCGYNDTSNFVRRFRRQFHITPLQFRIRNRQGATEPLIRA